MKKSFVINEDGILKRFMKEFFPFKEFNKIGFFGKEIKNNYGY